jgi:hypothetical protein
MGNRRKGPSRRIYTIYQCEVPPTLRACVASYHITTPARHGMDACDFDNSLGATPSIVGTVVNRCGGFRPFAIFPPS